jgi:hypothetical protein
VHPPAGTGLVTGAKTGAGGGDTAAAAAGQPPSPSAQAAASRILNQQPVAAAAPSTHAGSIDLEPLQTLLRSLGSLPQAVDSLRAHVDHRLDRIEATVAALGERVARLDGIVRVGASDTSQ